MVRAVVLAAGASSRMGRPKAGLPLAHCADTFLARILQTLTAAPLPDIAVVTGAAPDAVHAAAGRIRPPVRFVRNDRWQAGQLASIQAGLGERPGEQLEALLVALVDIPLFSVATVRQVLAAWRATGAPIVRPARGEEHGHPVLFDRALFDALWSADPSVGAKAVVRAHAPHIVNVEVDDEGAFTDVDTVEEYHALRRRVLPEDRAAEVLADRVRRRA